VCRDFKYGQCVRPACKFVHLLEDHVEVTDMKVSVCRDAVKGKCSRGLCKYYHLPVVLPPAPLDPQSCNLVRLTQSTPRLTHALHNPQLSSSSSSDNNTSAIAFNDNIFTTSINANNIVEEANSNTTTGSSIQVISSLSNSNIICN